MFNNRKFCIKAEPDNTPCFGDSVAINNKYLAISDPLANNIVIYKPNQFGNWTRISKIFPPIDSMSHKLGSGFGLNLQLDGHTLVTSAKNVETQNYYINPLNSPLSRYLIRLNRENKMVTIPPIMQKKDGMFEFNLLSKGRIRQIILSDNGEENFGYFGNGVAFYENLLLIGSPSKNNKSRAWLINLNKIKNKPILLESPDSIIGESVAISNKFAVVSAGRNWYSQEYYKLPTSPRPRTFIRAINGGSAVVINHLGELSLSGNILALMLPNSPGRFNSSLQLFHLDNNATPNLIEKRKYLKKAWIQNDYLITISAKDFITGIREICVESI